MFNAWTIPKSWSCCSELRNISFQLLNSIEDVMEFPTFWFWWRLSLVKSSAGSIRSAGILILMDNFLLTIRISALFFQWLSSRKWIWYNLKMQFIFIDSMALCLVVVIWCYMINAMKSKKVVLLFLIHIISNQNHTPKTNKRTNYLRAHQQTDLVLLIMKYFQLCNDLFTILK